MQDRQFAGEAKSLTNLNIDATIDGLAAGSLNRDEEANGCSNYVSDISAVAPSTSLKRRLSACAAYY
jgi:hypothetical protein